MLNDEDEFKRCQGIVEEARTRVREMVRAWTYGVRVAGSVHESGLTNQPHACTSFYRTLYKRTRLVCHCACVLLKVPFLPQMEKSRKQRKKEGKSTEIPEDDADKVVQHTRACLSSHNHFQFVNVSLIWCVSPYTFL